MSSLNDKVYLTWKQFKVGLQLSLSSIVRFFILFKDASSACVSKHCLVADGMCCVELVVWTQPYCARGVLYIHPASKFIRQVYLFQLSFTLFTIRQIFLIQGNNEKKDNVLVFRAWETSVSTQVEHAIKFYAQPNTSICTNFSLCQSKSRQAQSSS